MKRFAAFFTILLLVLGFAAPARAADDPGTDTWMAVYLGGAKSGWMHQQVRRVEEDGEVFWITEAEAHIELARMGQKMTIVQKIYVREDAAGQVVEFMNSQEMGGLPQKTSGRLNEEGRLVIDAMGSEQVVDYPEGALGSAAVERALRAEPLEPGRVVTVKAFSPEAPSRGITATMTIGEPVKKDVLGRVLMVYPVLTENDLMPMPQTVFVTEDGEMVAMEMQVPMLGKMEMLTTEEEFAKAESEPAEVFVTSLIAPDRAIPNPRELERAVYRIRRKGSSSGAMFEDARQKVLGVETTIEIFTPDPEGIEAFTLPVTDEALANYLEPNSYIESEDETVKALADEAVGDETDAIAAAAKIERYVRKKIADKNLGVGFATAAEVADTLEGDCTEHAVLCAGIARAKGLPARVVTGLVYLPPGQGPGETGVFGYHMWTEVLVAKDFWLPIDAAIGTWDATHIAMAKSDLSGLNPNLDLTLAILEMMGDLTIEVVEP